MRRLLPDIGDRRTRVRLLAWSYEDAAFAEADGGRTGKPASRALSRNEELWEAGSYRELERALDRLREADVFQHRLFWALFVRGAFTDQQPSGALERVTALMPSSVYVPEVISEAAGYTPSVARQWARPRTRIAA